MTEKNQLGSKITQLRESKGMSIEDLAKASDSSIELIECLEKGNLVPSLTPLLKIARALSVRLGTFLDDAPQNGPVITKSGNYESVVRFSGKLNGAVDSKLNFYSLAFEKQDRHMEPFLIDVYPFETNEYKLSSHEGEEFIFVISGEIEILYGSEKYLLKTGDSIYYDSVVPHDLHAFGNSLAKILAVIYAPF
ncbi:Cupin 2 conserved barrel domain protein [Methanococcus vannielii SB]|jgi:transcriptional regulator with XRE-family HTH domain|uniref:Cupin 2 conserved barrel domain protein n=1 Tax=Methanococcus vannielii (strain ATCC 35089 / DSM 1224 / JCM 13029 / OCM 148 / SB) TaxID=406327 RepID=A6US66_METVS|nr:XRE family transcriptional regulator [Methanococcus vannielii]ABR55338.1 Cupin 2 conserved barrel domain protein [Methanococcus vannielii SB]